MADPSDPSDRPTRKSDGPPTPLDGDTLDAPPPPEPHTATAGTHSHIGEPPTASIPRAGADAGPVSNPPGFVIVRELGSGGMGIVYEARQTKLNRMVALKVLRSARNDTQSVIRFMREAEAVAEVKHPNVVQVYEVNQYADGPFMALELLTGGTLSDRIRRGGRFEPRAAAELLVRIAGAVQAAHDLGIVHRDLKPGNVLFDDAGVPKVTDFGLAKKAGVDLTHTQGLMGTPAYMAPEQARGEARFVGPPADVWALGAILYECLTGKRAFDADDTWAVLRKVTDEHPAAPRTHVPGLPRDLELIALKCLEKTPADRYPSAAAFAADLDNYLAGRPVTVRPAGPIERATKWAKRNPAIAALTAGVALALVIGSAVSLAFALQARQRSDELTKTNADLSRTNDDLAKANEDLTTSRNVQAKLNEVLKNARAGLIKQAGELIEANAAAGERGYLSDIALAHQLWKANDLRGMRAALERCPGGYRRWEWHYLDRLSRPEKEVLATDSLALALAYSPDGKWLAHLTVGGTFVVRDRATGRESSYTVDRPSGHHRHIAFRPDSKELAFAVHNRSWVATLDPWDVKEVTPKSPNGKPLSAHMILALGYAKDGALLSATTTRPEIGNEWVVLIRELRLDKTVATLNTGVKAPVSAGVMVDGGAFSSDGNRFATAFVDSGFRVGFADQIDKEKPFEPVVQVWDVATEKLLGTAGGARQFGNLAFDPDSRSIGFGRRGWAGELVIKDGGQRFVGDHTGGVLTVAFDKNGLIWSGGEDKFICAHDRVTGTERYHLRGCAHTIFRVAASPDGKEVAAATGDLFAGAGAVHRYDVAALDTDVWRSSADRNRLSVVYALSPGGSRFAGGDYSLGGEMQAGPRFFVRERAGGHTREVKTPPWPGVAFRSDSGFVLLEGNEFPVRKEWLRLIGPDGKTDDRVELPTDERSEPRSVLAGSADGKTVAVVSPLRRDEEGNRRRIIGRLRTRDAVTGAAGKESELDLSAGFPRGTSSGRLESTAAAFDPTGRQLAAAFVFMWNKPRGGTEQRGAVVVWDALTGAELFRQFTLDPMRAVCFAPDGTLVAAGGGPGGGIVYGWDVETGERAFVMLGHTRAVLAVAVGPNGRLATGSTDRTVKVWDMASRREILTLDGFARPVAHVAFTADGKELVAATGIDRLDPLTILGGVPDTTPAEVRTFRGPK